MKVAFAAVSDLLDVRQGSGTFYYLAQEIERQGHSVTRIGPFTLKVPFTARLVNAVHRRMRKRHALFLDPFVGKRTGLQVAQRLAGLNYDVLLTNDMAIAAFTPTSKPVVIYTDVMITLEYTEKDLPGCRLGNMSSIALGLCRQTLRLALQRSSLAIFPTEWSAKAARAYSREVGRIRVIPFGANVTDPGPAIAAGRSWEKVSRKGCIDLLFVGKDWARKGGEVAVEVVRLLNIGGLKARLHVAGADVPVEVPPDQVLKYGLLDKSKPEEMQLLNRLFTEADAFILPSSSEGYVISALEAAAFGLPTLAYDADGVRNAVVDGSTGRLFPLGSPASVYAEAVKSWQNDPVAYESLVKGARQHYETSANWPACVNRLMECIETTLKIPASRKNLQRCQVPEA